MTSIGEKDVTGERHTQGSRWRRENRNRKEKGQKEAFAGEYAIERLKDSNRNIWAMPRTQVS